jgi:hypothetical protein
MSYFGTGSICRNRELDGKAKFMATQKYWILKYVAGNPAMFTRVRTDGSGPGRCGEVLRDAEKVAANGWRVWVEHAVSGERIFESDVEKAYRQAEQVTA